MGPRRRARARPDIGEATACHADAVSKVYGRRDTAVHALRDVTLSIERGTFTAIMGPSGSGKSTLLHCLAALDTPTAGRVFLGRTELTALSRRQQAQIRRDRIGFVFQAFNLVPTLDALENITLPQRLAGRRPDRQWLDHVIDTIGLGDRLRHRPGELSGGQQQRVALARALAGRPEVIFADEPTGNLDTTASGEMLTLLRDAVDQFDRTVITVTHDPAIARYADRVLFFTDGRVVDHADRPDVDQVLERVQAANGSTGHHVRPRQDGHDTMRSRRRRQSDATTPGRPMVGSDDEVEVARQERWLQRIREQFEAEQGVAEQNDDTWSTEPTLQRDGGAFAQRPLTPPLDTGAHQPHGGWADGGDPAASWTPPPDRVDDGWLPTERSWVDADEPGAEPARRSHDGQTTTPEPTPWSRPDDPSADGDATGRQPANAGASGADPWAPPDRDLAEEYRHGAGNTSPPRNQQADEHGRDRWSTSDKQEQRDEHRDATDHWPHASPNGQEHASPNGQEQRDHHRDVTDHWPHASPNGHEPTGAPSARTPGDSRHARRFEEWRPPADDVTPHGWTSDSGRHPDTPAGRNGDPGAGHDAPRDHGNAEPDPPPVWTPRTEEPVTEDRTSEPDPWSDVWDTTSGGDVADIWSPPSRNGHRPSDTAWHEPPQPDPVHETPTRDDAHAADDPTPHADAPPVDTPDTTTLGDTPPAGDRAAGASPRPDPGDDAATPPANPASRPVEAEPLAPDTMPGPHTNGRADDATRNGSRPGAPRTEPMIPPELASLRNLRRPDEPVDTAAALQSLQAQLARLDPARGQPNGSGRPRRGRPSDANRPQRH